ncbi:2-oxo-4-hydroxy-4-carboxy-5-ureidoimidazoline decarboxylase [Wenjunlia tyrosinilytica]|uniref:2-oxo-4-hydroxy-4-carboxy-5-ureidoimidazoline decarboxylase n=1 Tax=Wenjunlia tyrosinilytica TaxID=1544741 RepID=A0A918DZ12_9ACTN|nr:2-oxo-4-hydroxy-4-carboxy-5-ureidoimidazoline decarboxylase [Wenjunlia tyrosinilytica]GGO92475.1 2-oxo-4-hydroxy-4-carboxy-5-ureidoimidazoline decarboxylase [Wenjunlia tyrosinilytica]
MSSASSLSNAATTGLAWLNAAAEEEAAPLLHEVCSARAWGQAVLSARPYADTGALFAASDRATAALTDSGLEEAMAGHPPIGRPKAGDPTSAREQSGVRESQREELLEMNLRYQDTFGHVFLICATGRTGDEMLAALRERLGNTPEREREIVRVELGRINRIRLDRLVTEKGGTV